MCISSLFMKSKVSYNLSIHFGFCLYPNLTINILLIFPNIKRTIQGFHINSFIMGEMSWRCHRRKKITMTIRDYSGCCHGETLSGLSTDKIYQQRFRGYMYWEVICILQLNQKFYNKDFEIIWITQHDAMLTVWMDLTGHRLITAGLVKDNKLYMNSLGSNY